jgi:DNA-binding NarL/FixJ family response regulator
MMTGPGPEPTRKPAAIRVVVADDHPVFLSGLRTLVEEAPDLELVGAACDGLDALQLCRASPPDVVLMDVRMPNASGVAATATLATELPDVRVLMLTMLEDDTSLLAALRAGARGYVLKGAAPEAILRAVRAVAAGQAIFDLELANGLPRLLNEGQRPYPFPELSRRERDVTALLAAGHSNGTIAAKLGLSEKTVRNNVSAILVKLRAADRAAAIIRAREAGIVARRSEEEPPD